MQEWNQKGTSPYQQEAKERWGNTPAYQEFSEKNSGMNQEKMDKLAAGLDEIMGGFAACMGRITPDAPEAAALVDRLQAYLTAHYYTCTDDILSGLGEMYVADQRFRRNIDRHGAGTAAFLRETIRAKTGKG